MSDSCSVKEDWVEHGIEDHAVRDSNGVLVGFRFVETPMWHIK